MEWTPQAKQVFQVQSYAPRPSIDGVQITELRRHHDDGGSMTELARLTEGAPAGLTGFTLRQINFSEIEPGAIKAFHLHTRQTDVWFVPPTDKILLCVGDVRAGSATEKLVQRIVLGDGRSFLVRIPPGVAHGCKNLRPDRASVIVYFVDLHFSVGDDCDEGRLPWDHFGAEVWEVERG